jgi:hypothetical protein
VHATRLGLLGLLAVVLVVGGTAVGGLVAAASDVPVGMGSTLGLVAGALLSGAALHRGFAGHEGRRVSR